MVRVDGSSLVTAAGPCRIYTGFPILLAQREAPRNSSCHPHPNWAGKDDAGLGHRHKVATHEERLPSPGGGGGDPGPYARNSGDLDLLLAALAMSARS
jgi:hypothetical protein